MKRSVLLCLVLLTEVFLFPLLLVGGIGAETEPAEETETPASAETESAEVVQTSVDRQTTVTVLTDEGVVEAVLADYLWGVVAAEMPASFEEEALKAQAVAARTETLYRLAHPTENHPDAAVCTDYSCCQAYLDYSDALTRWGEDGEANGVKIAQAVADTDGLVVEYQGEVIQALFHSSSAGTTLSAAEVWGGDVPYLTGVASPEGEEVPNYYSVVTVSAEEFRTAVLEAYPESDLSGDPAAWQLELQYNDSGNLADVVVGGVTIPATQIRTLFGLRSARFTLEAGENEVTFYVTGYGHGVGMSQYGANEMAREGSSFREILEWYYTGVEVVQFPS